MQSLAPANARRLTMTIQSTRQWDTSQWAASERMYPPPDWHGVSPEVIARRGRPWNQDPRDVPWLDKQGCETEIEARLNEQSISDDEAQLLRQWVKDGYFIVKGAIPTSSFGL